MPRKRKSYQPTFSVDPEEQRYLSNIYNQGKPGHDPYPTIKTSAPSQAYREGWDRVFGGKGRRSPAVDLHGRHVLGGRLLADRGRVSPYHARKHG